MKKVRNVFINNLRYLCLVGVIAVGLMTIVGTGGDDPTLSKSTCPYSGGWIYIDYPTEEQTYTTTHDEICLSGSAFISLEHSRAEDSGVTVVWENETSGERGSAFQRVYYHWIFKNHDWHAWVPLVAGDNHITVIAFDPSDIGACDSITVTATPSPPTVSSTYPVNNESRVDLGNTIVATFSAAMDASTITTSTFTLTDAINNPISGTVAYTDKTAIFTPLHNLAPSTTYTATITTGVRSLARLAMIEDHIWSFATGTTNWRWQPTSTTAPSGRSWYTAVWTGTEMIVWGGSDSDGITNTGSRYDPSIDSWSETSPRYTPSARSRHTAVWTGTEMIVWGGSDSDGITNTGGRYSP